MIILKILVLLILVILVLAYFAPNKWTIDSSIVIKKPIAAVFDYIKFLKNAEQYNKWVMSDPNMQREFRGNDGNIGFVYCWHSTKGNAGKGEQEITLILENQQVDCEIRFEKPFQSVSTTSMKLSSISPNETQVNWSFNGSNNYMMKVMHVVFNLKKKLQKDMFESLTLLKTKLEA